jgi:hypothetical protein
MKKKKLMNEIFGRAINEAPELTQTLALETSVDPYVDSLTHVLKSNYSRLLKEAFADMQNTHGMVEDVCLIPDSESGVEQVAEQISMQLTQDEDIRDFFKRLCRGMVRKAILLRDGKPDYL